MNGEWLPRIFALHERVDGVGSVGEVISAAFDFGGEIVGLVRRLLAETLEETHRTERENVHSTSIPERMKRVIADTHDS